MKVYILGLNIVIDKNLFLVEVKWDGYMLKWGLVVNIIVKFNKNNCIGLLLYIIFILIF